MSRRTNDGGPAAPVVDTISTTTTQHDHGQGSAAVLAAVTVDPPCPGRRMWTYRVVDPRGHVHMHRCGPPREDGYRRTAPCGAVYLIVGCDT
jgi:hypothetical protein